MPSGRCGNCQSPVYWIKGKYRFTCLCAVGFSTGMISFAHGAVINPQPVLSGSLLSETPQIASELTREASDQPEEEITPTRAAKVYQQLFRAIYHHQATCSDCDILDTMCHEQSGLWHALRFWGRRMETEENLSA